jgi:hypothetical protein
MMKLSLVFSALVALTIANPLVRRQGVTASIAPSGTAPAGCLPTYAGSFGLVVMNITTSSGATVTSIPDGQLQATTAPVISTISEYVINEKLF